jgi:glycosyltransferase involved in cell wall biosynthesis
LSNPRTILIFTDWYHPGYRAGGPVQSVYNLAQVLSRHFLVRVVTRITDLNSDKPFEGIEPDVWTKLGDNHFVKYLDSGSLTRKHIKVLIQENKDNILLVNGLYSLYFSIFPSFYAMVYKVARVYISVRGMLHQSALSFKPLRKQVFLAFARGFGLYKNAVLLATSESESSEISKSLGKMAIRIAPNIPMIPNVSGRNRIGFKKNGVLNILFLGRIAPEKNAVALLDALALVDGKCTVTFCGTYLDQHYFNEFTKKLRQLPENIHHAYLAELPHHQIGQLLNATDIMAMPSLGENFGHAIFESFVHSVPVIIGNNTPWTGIEQKSAGIEVNPADVIEIKRAIERFANMESEEYATWAKGAFTMSQAYFEENNFEEIYLRLFS